MMARRLVFDTRGAAVIEFAFALPILVALMIGVLQFGMVLHASGGVRHAVGEGIRYAKVHPDATDTEILDVARAGLAGINAGGIQALNIQRGQSNGADYRRITMRYRIAPVIPFAPIPPIVIEEARTAYLPS
jgi:Flp pilus assembly protein TadG